MMRGTGRTVERCRYCGNDQQTDVCCLLGFVCVICEADSFQKYLLTCWKLSGSSCADTHLLVFHFLDALDGLLFTCSFYSEGNFEAVVFVFYLLEKQNVLSPGSSSSPCFPPPPGDCLLSE